MDMVTFYAFFIFLKMNKYFLMNHYLLFLQQLLHCISYLNSFLRCFHLWNCVLVLFLCPKTSMFSQHILHYMDCHSAHSDDVYVLAFKGMLLKASVSLEYHSLPPEDFSALFPLITSVEKGEEMTLIYKI